MWPKVIWLLLKGVATHLLPVYYSPIIYHVMLCWWVMGGRHLTVMKLDPPSPAPEAQWRLLVKAVQVVSQKYT